MKNLFFCCLLLSSCTIPRKYQKNKPFLFKNSIDINGGNFTKDQRNSLKQKLYGQLDDSAKVTTKDLLFLLHFINRPPAYDSGYSDLSAKSMKGSMLHLGYYNAKVSFTADTSTPNGRQQRVAVKYTVAAGNPTLIDTISYRLKQAELQQLALDTRPKSYLVKGKAVTRADILSEISRLVELYRNNGYYKFTSDDLKMRGDSAIAALTNISDDPFENLQLLEEANQQRDKPTVKLAMVLNPVSDSLRLKKYFIDSIIIYPDFRAADAINSAPYTEDIRGGYVIRYHKKLFHNSLLLRNMNIRKGEVYSQENYAKTISNFSKSGVWQNTNIQVDEIKGGNGKINMIVQLLPAKKYGFEANIESSYSANSNTNSASIANAGNLLGVSTNVSLQNRNVGKSGTKMTHALRAGMELNLNAQQGSDRKLNSTELSYTNTISFPRLLGPIKLFYPNKKRLPAKPMPNLATPRLRRDSIANYLSQQTFINVVPAYSNRINLFDQLSASVAFGNEFTRNKHPNRKNLFKFLNIEYSFLYNQSDSFKRTLELNPYLRYSFNTALVIGLINYGYSSTYINPKKLNHLRSFRWNIEESGLLLGRFDLFKKDLRQFIKTDIEYTFLVQKAKSSRIFRVFAGVGIPIGKGDSSLPFFKQYFAGGANSMRGWPIRGIGPGAKALAPYNLLALNDRTGDVRFEMNGEYRYDIAQIIPNSIVLKGALFIDAGNVWNFKNTRTDGGPDSLQFDFKKLYQQLGVTAGTGFRFDFNYFLIRFDLGFRFKRPDIARNNGWQIPNITFNNLLKKGEQVEIAPGVFGNRNRIWRYENFNFTIGLSYPF
ncbi:MAG: BamA/TamA family outer membrane protein [Ferruginibacter sp.]|nr:BamA/TamA family outer membrane protein [Ferruginibacter sp.]